MKRKLVFPGKVEVNFRRGPHGYLRQDPSDEAKKIKNNPNIQERLPALREDKVKENARSIVFLRGGDVSDRQELLGEYLVQFGKYKGNSFRWILENDIGYVVYLIHKVEEEERAGQFNPEGPKKENLLSFLEYCRSFSEIVELLEYLSKKSSEPEAVVEVDENLVGFGVHSKKTWREIWENRADGYATFILQRNCVPGSKMYRLQQYLQQRTSQSASEQSLPSASSYPSEMEADEELERVMLTLSPSKLLPHDAGSEKKTEQKMVACPPAGPRHQGRQLGNFKATAAVSKPDQAGDCSTPVTPTSASSKRPVPVPPELLALKIPLSKTTPPLRPEPVLGLRTPAASSRSSASPAASGQPEVAHSTAPAPPSSFSAAPVGDPPDAFGDQPAAPSLPSYDQDVKRWNCSHQQRIWMKTEMESLGLWPGSRPVRHLMNMISLWRYPPQPELIDSIQNLPSPKYFHLHPFFIWKPEHTIMERVRNNYSLPCLYSCTNPHVVSSGVGRPRVVISTTCQYYILASRLSCRGCKKYWFADKPQWIDMLPGRLKNIFPAYLTHKKGICRTVMDELRRSGRSPNDMANQLNEALHLKYERAHLSYLSSVKNVLDGEIGLYGQKTITASLRATNTADPFGGYADADGWFGVTVEAHYLVDCLIQEYRRQEDTLNLLLQGTFGQAFRADHTRKVARKVVLASGTMSSYAVMNENWMILSWVMLQSETDKSLEPMYAGLSSRYISAGQPKATHQWVDRDCCAAFRIPNPEPHEHLLWDSWKTTDAAVAEATSGSLTNSCASRRKYNSEISIKLDLFHCMRRFSRECTSEHHPLYSTFCKFLSAAFCVVDQADLQRLRQAYIFCGIEPPNPTKQHIRDHCRNKIPGPAELVERVESVLQRFYSERDPDGVPLFKPSMLKVWRIQRVHILRGCLSDPEVGEGVLYRHGGTIQLNHVKGEKAAVPVWIPVRGTSQQEGFHFHQARWVTGTQVSTELFQAQGMMGIARWNFQRLVDLKQPDLKLPAVFDPVLVSDLNRLAQEIIGQTKYPALHISNSDTGERFGLQYLEPGCRPVPLNWDKNKSQKVPPAEDEAFHYKEPKTECEIFIDPLEEVREELFVQGGTAAVATLGSQGGVQQSPKKTPVTPLLPAASPRAARKGPIKAGGLIFVLDHSRWTQPMRDKIDQLLQKHHGQKDCLVKVDAEYAVCVQASQKDPNSLLHPTTKHHISRYVKHLAKMKNTKSSLNISPEKLLETQQLWHHLTEGSETVSVPVVTIPPATVNPPTIKPQDAPLTKAQIEQMVKEIVQQQQQQKDQQPMKKRTRNCLACGQPKSRFQGDGSSVHFFYQSAEVKYFYCSQKVYQTYVAEGLSDPRMSFSDFADTPFFARELEAAKRRAAEVRRVMEERGKRKAKEEQPAGRLCRFCHRPLKQGPNSSHVHTGFPGVNGKYIYCPAKVLSLYQSQGMKGEMTWGEFSQSSFYEAEKERWAAEKGK